MKTSKGKKINVKKLIIVGCGLDDSDSEGYIEFLNNLLNKEIFEYKTIDVN